VRQVPDTQRVISGAVTSTSNVIPAQGAGTLIRVRLAQVTNEIADLVSITFQESGVSPVIGFAGAMAAIGGGSNIDWGEGWVLRDNRALFMTVTARGGVLTPITNVSILEFFIIGP
jgi:hypothetical protein